MDWRANTVLPRIHRICVLPCPRWKAVVQVSGPDGDRAIPFDDFHRLPGDTPQFDTNLRSD